MEQQWAVETEGQAIADALVRNRAEVLVREAREFVLVALWADVHDEDSLTSRDGAGRVLPGTERAKQLGGHGTAKVAEFACADLAVLLERGYIAASNLIRDALDVRERHPLLWTQITATAAADPATIADGLLVGVQVWQAREVAKACHVAGLSRDRARLVDRETTPVIGSMPWGRFLSKLAGAIIDADPDGAEAKRRAEAMRRFVATGQCNEYGLKTMILKAQAGDVICLNALFDRLARILALEGDTDPYDVRKAKATAIIANPYEAVRLLEKYATTTDEDTVQQSECGDDAADEQREPNQGPAPGQIHGHGHEHGVLDLFGDRPIDAHEPTGDAPKALYSNIAGADRLQGQGQGSHHRDMAGDSDRVSDSGLLPSSSPPGPTSGGPPPGDRPADPPHDAPRSSGPPGRLRPGDLHPADDDSEDPPHPARRSAGPCPACGGTTAPRTAWRKVDPDKLLPHATVYVHVSQASFLRGAGGVARFENGIGPVTIEQAVEFLGHRRVTVKPVIDLALQVPVDAYEVPTRLREVVRLARPASVFPYATSTAPSMDLDHAVPYHPMPLGGKPGQTGLHNLAPLNRFEHRVKTHARGWIHRQPEPGVYLWRNRYGYWYRVDPTGTHPLGKHPDLTDQQPAEHPQAAALRTLRDTGTTPPDGSPLEAAFARLIPA